MTLKFLIAEDNCDLAKAIAFAVRMAWPGCRVHIAADGAEAVRAFAAEPADVTVLDVMMPLLDGFEACRIIREVSAVPSLMLTVRDGTMDKVRALDLGADDYLTKPFDHLELLARLRALLRRAHQAGSRPEPAVVNGDLVIDFTTHEVRLRGEPVRLTPTEHRLLEELARNVGIVLPHHVLLERVWGPELITDPSYLKVFVQRLRQKLGDDAAQPRYIQTERGTGYRFLRPR